MAIDEKPVLARVTTLWAGLYVPARAGDVVRLGFQRASAGQVCEDRAFTFLGYRHFADVVASTPPPGYAHLDDVLLGLGPAMSSSTGTRASPVLQHTSQLYFIESDGRVEFRLHIPVAPCIEWCWTALDAGRPDVYALPLRASSSKPWTSGVIDLGRWNSVLPRAGDDTNHGAQDDNVTQQLTTSAGCTFLLNAGSYFVPESAASTEADTAILGASAGLASATLAIDLEKNRIGIGEAPPVLTTAIG